MHLLYPSEPFDRNRPDEEYAEEFAAAFGAGFRCFLFSLEDFDTGKFTPRPAAQFSGAILYRGWMLTPDRYADLAQAIALSGASPVVSPEQFRHCHYLPEWYAACRDLTPKTIFLSKDDDFVAALSDTGWPAFFVKDFVKSLTTSRGSVAKDAAEVKEVVALIEQYRGQIEGGVCVREWEDLLPDTEERFFVLHGRPMARDGIIPQIVQDIAGRIGSAFFSIDIVLNRDGVPRLIELGDGQVSDRKKWPAQTFIAALMTRRASPEELIKSYIDAYNRFDIEGMCTLLTLAIRFEHYNNGTLGAEASGLQEFRALAETGAALFAERQQRVTAVRIDGDRAVVEIAFHGKLAADIPGGPSAGTVLTLNGTSEFTFADGAISHIIDRG